MPKPVFAVALLRQAACVTLAFLGIGSASADELLLPPEKSSDISLEGGQHIRVTSAIVQMQLAEHAILSATKGAEFILLQASPGEYWIHMGAGKAWLADLEQQQIVALEPGTWRLTEATENSSPTVQTAQPARSPLKQEFHFDDYIYLRQRPYLDSLTVPRATMNQAFGSLIRFFTRSTRTAR